MTLVLGIESSCDETSVALLDGEGRILSSVVGSQFDAHRAYGGVVPEIAARAHLTNLPTLLDAAFEKAGKRLAEVTLVAATAGPGLVGALLVGLSEAKGLAYGLDVPFVPVHHVEGHAVSPFLSVEGGPAETVPETFSALVVSGGHTHLYAVSTRGIELLARTRDDAAGEAYDKVAKMAGLGYPGGPVVDRLARSGKARAPFSIARFKDDTLDFSFSGLKTAVRERLAGGEADLADLMHDFQEAVVAQLEDRLSRALARRRFGVLSVSGGVAANSLLRERLALWGTRRGVGVVLPHRALTSDNAAMIAFAGLLRFRRGETGQGLDAPARSRWPLESVS
jgi:N6-L-threonylcarbamoyladenine synthase